MRRRYSVATPAERVSGARKVPVSKNGDGFTYPADVVRVAGLALDPRASSYLRTDFTVEQGLPDDEVNAIAQTPNGFLWVGTDGGLARFDGEHFTQIRLRAGISKEISVSSLLTAADGGTLGGHRFRSCLHTGARP